MLRSAQSMQTRELLSLLRKAFVLGFSLGVIGFMVFILASLGNKDDLVVVGIAAMSPLFLALLGHAMYGRILAELSRRLGGGELREEVSEAVHR